MAARGNLDDALTPPTGGAVMEPAAVSAMLDEHARLRSLLRNAVAARSAPDNDYWVGIGLDEVVVDAESPEAVMTAIERRGMAGGTVVMEFVSSVPQVFVL